MALDVPTADEFIERFPTFDGRDDLIEAMIAECVLGEVNENWLTKDQKRAIMYWVAHSITMEDNASDNSGQVRMEKTGDIMIQYDTGVQSGMTPSNYNQTEYGRRFIELRKRNFPSVVVI
jgi:hypothetical protein